MATDQELVEQVRRGEREAYAELFQKHYAGIYAICLSMVKNPQDAEELAQDMFVHAYLKLDQLRNPARFFPWLKKMAHNRSRNYAQRTKARIIQIPFSGAQQKSAAPDEELLRREVMEAIMEAIEALPAKDREVIQARIDGLNHMEISERFGISIKASMTRLYRARRKLAEHLKGLYSIFGLSKIIRLKEIISGGVMAMKLGTGVKMTIGVISVLAVGFTGFQIATRQPDQEISPPTQAIQEASAESPRILKTSRQTPAKRNKQTDSATALSNSSEEDMKMEEVENSSEVDDIHADSATTEDISQKSVDGKPWESDTGYQQLKQEFQTKLKLRDEVSSRLKELAKERNQLPKRRSYKSRSDPEYQKRLSLAKERDSLSWQHIALYEELKELWAAMEAIKRSYRKEDTP